MQKWYHRWQKMWIIPAVKSSRRWLTSANMNKKWTVSESAELFKFLETGSNKVEKGILNEISAMTCWQSPLCVRAWADICLFLAGPVSLAAVVLDLAASSSSSSGHLPSSFSSSSCPCLSLTRSDVSCASPCPSSSLRAEIEPVSEGGAATVLKTCRDRRCVIKQREDAVF